LLDNDGMASLSPYGRTSAAVHRIGLPLVWCPMYRRPVLGGRVADRLRRYLAEQTTRPEKGKP
jgi:putative transposase